MISLRTIPVGAVVGCEIFQFFEHSGIYIGDGKFIHAPRTGASVRVEDMRVAYWNTRFNGARRVPLQPSTHTAVR